MPRDIFRNRASALEDEFFHRVDQELIARLKQKEQQEADEDALTIATGITDRTVLDELLSVQITPQTLLAFQLFPAIHVAWASGYIQRAEREAVLKAAEHLGVVPETPAWELLQSWLQKKPSAELFEAWTDFIHALRPTMSVTAFRELHETSMTRARKVAETSGGILGIHRVSADEEARLADLEAVFADAALASEK
ncbi:MAG: hypothetical protein R3C59_27700 [Planctomycetaceae bacterium]